MRYHLYRKSIPTVDVDAISLRTSSDVDMNWKLLAALSFVVVVTIFIEGITTTDKLKRDHNKWKSLLSWTSYMRHFHKKYSSLSQQLARQKLFMARAVEVFVTGVKYRLRKLNYYTAINKYSDLTPEESERMVSGADYGSSEPLMSDEEAGMLLLEALEIQDLYTELITDSSIKSQNRKKRSVEDDRMQGRALSIADLIRLENERHPERNIKLEWIIPSNNPHYEPFEAPTRIEDNRSLNDIPATEVKEIELQTKAVGSDNGAVDAIDLVKGALTSAMNWFLADTNSDGDEDETEEESNEITEQRSDIIVRSDWRRSNCIGPVRDQGYCASCYAMSSMGYTEWALCMNRSQVFTPLSVQYVVDCGKQFKEESGGNMWFDGCNKAHLKQTMNFVKEYGLELEANMPYLEQETRCPFEITAPHEKRGYIRPKSVKPPIRLAGSTTKLDLALKRGPVMVSMREPKSFIGYAGGILDSCNDRGGHAMLVVGDMIEDGIEYLIIKNSYGPDWGYGGYLKFRRSAAAECVKEFIVPVLEL